MPCTVMQEMKKEKSNKLNQHYILEWKPKKQTELKSPWWKIGSPSGHKLNLIDTLANTIITLIPLTCSNWSSKKNSLNLPCEDTCQIRKLCCTAKMTATYLLWMTICNNFILDVTK